MGILDNGVNLNHELITHNPKARMEDTFDIPVTYKNKELLFTGQLLQLGYIHKISIDVHGEQILLEKDDEGNYRAVLANINSESKIDRELIKAIVESFEMIVR